MRLQNPTELNSVNAGPVAPNSIPSSVLIAEQNREADESALQDAERDAYRETRVPPRSPSNIASNQEIEVSSVPRVVEVNARNSAIDPQTREERRALALRRFDCIPSRRPPL